MSGPRLYLDLGSEPIDRKTALSEADGFILDPGDLEPPRDDLEQTLMLRGVTPLDSPAWTERDVGWVCVEGLDQTARLRDGWPSLRWIPCIETYCPPVRYDFAAAAPGEGFSVYRPDTSTIQQHKVADHEEDLRGWLARAKGAGFRTVWLHSRDAAKRGRGLDLDLLDLSRRLFTGGQIWISGGATDPQHLENLAANGGATAVVLPGAVAERCSCVRLLTALGRPAGAFETAAERPAAAPGRTPAKP